MYVGYQLTDASRNKLLELFPPKYSRVFGHHITTKFGTKSEEDIPGYTEDVQVVAYADSGDGLEALVVSINGDVRKADGSPFHITWSLDPNHYKPVDSNKVCQEHQVKVDPISIQVVPKMFQGKTPFTDRNVNETFLEYLKRV
jgi:hypothetical protein